MTKAMNIEVHFAKTDNRDAVLIRQVNAVHLSSSWQSLTDTAEIVLPRNVKAFDKNKVKEIFKRGDAVTIKMGYDGELPVEFIGYVKNVSADIPIKISCEDEMMQLKKIPVNYSSADVTLKDMLTDLVPGYELDVQEGILLGAVRFSQTNVGEVLEKLQQDYKLYTYFEPTTKKLVSGKIYSDNSREKIYHFDLERNVVSNNLSYKNADDVHVKVRGTAIHQGVKLAYEYGDDQPDKTIDWQFTVKTQAALEKEVKRLYEQNKRGGFSGSFVSFGIPSVQHGRKVHLTSRLYEDREGIYYIDKLQKSFSENGYRQQINLGRSYGTGK